MKQGVKKAWTCIVLILCCMLSGCSNTSAPEEDYLGEIFIASAIRLGCSGETEEDADISSYVEEFQEGLGAFTGRLPIEDCFVRVELKKGSEAQGVVYLTENVQEAVNPVITSKWMYYSEVYAECKYRNKENVFAIADSAYCYEKLVCFPTCYVCSNPDHPDCDCGVQKGELEDSSLCEEVFCEETLQYPREVEAVAAHKYNVYYDAEERIGKPVTVTHVHTRRLMWSNDEKWKAYTLSSADWMSGRQVTIVGYVETEADKIMENGIPMDKVSKEYQTVIKQLAHPVFYVVGK